MTSDIPIEDRKYVLRFPMRQHYRIVQQQYYTGQQPSTRLSQAKIFSLGQAKGTKQFGHTTRSCEVIRVTDKMLFKAALEGK